MREMSLTGGLVQLGRTSLQVSRIGLGLAALGRPGYINLGHAEDLGNDYQVEAMRAHAWNVLDDAWSVGVRYFDAARSYGRAEEFLGSWLVSRGISPDECVIGSKWGYTYTAGWQIEAEVHEVKDHSLPTLQRQIAESQAQLDPYLDLYQIHSATESSGVLERVDVLDALARLRGDGRIRAIGLTLSGPDSAETLQRALQIKRDGQLLFDTVQATWNVLEPSLGPMLGEAHAAGMGIIVKEALANGRLSERNNDPGFVERKAVLEHETRRLGCSLDQLALAAVLDHPWAHCVLSGAARSEHLRSNYQSLDVRLDDKARRGLASIAQAPDDYWSERAALRWQ